MAEQRKTKNKKPSSDGRTEFHNMKITMEHEARIEAMLAEMTVEEKVAQMQQVSYEGFRPEVFERFKTIGGGSFLHVLGEDADEVREAAKKTRMKIPPIFGIDAIHGHSLLNGAVIFPTQLAMACSWNPELIKKMAKATAEEVNADGLDWVFSPVLCLGRDTRWGRIDETFGEDSYLVGELGAAMTEGYEEDGLVASCLKHYIGYGESTGAKDSYDSDISMRKLREMLLPPFRKSVEAGASTVMTAYGSIAGLPMTAHRELLRDVLKGELGFDGFVVTDWYNVGSLRTKQKAVESYKSGCGITVEAGNDMAMNSFQFHDFVIALVKEGQLDESYLDDSVRRILRVKFALGLFDENKKRLPKSVIACPEHIAVNHEVTKESMVLLENNGILPLKTAPKKIAVIGPNADDVRAQYGEWTFFDHPDEKPIGYEAKSDYYTVLRGVKSVFADSEVSYAKGCDAIEMSSDDMMEEAIALAGDSDLVIVVVGDVVAQHGETKDRANLDISGRQAELVRRLKATGKPVITVLINGKPLCLLDIPEHSDALIETFNGGDLGGLCVAEMIAGKFNPCGKLPISFPRTTGQMPCYYNYLPGWHGRYVDSESSSRYDFGYGLSYTEYEYSNLTISAETAKAEDTVTVSVDVKNIGGMDGYEIVEMYYNDLYSSVLTPIRQLCDFKKVAIKAGETVHVTFELPIAKLALVNAKCETVVEPGDFEIMVGPNLNSLQTVALKVLA